MKAKYKIVLCIIIIVISISFAVISEKIRHNNYKETILDADTTMTVLSQGLVTHRQKSYSIFNETNKDSLLILLSSNCISCLKFLPTVEIWNYIFTDSVDLYNLWINDIPLNLTRNNGIPDDINLSLQGISLSRRVPGIIYVENQNDQIFRPSRYDDLIYIDNLMIDDDKLIDGIIRYSESKHNSGNLKQCVLVFSDKNQEFRTELIGKLSNKMMDNKNSFILEFSNKMDIAENIVFDAGNLIRKILNLPDSFSLVIVDVETQKYNIYSNIDEWTG